MHHVEGTRFIPLPQENVFKLVDNHKNFSSHMNKSSWMMGGGAMTIELDKGEGREIGSHIKMKGSVLGMKLFLDEVVTKREPPFIKEWQTVGSPKLIVIGKYSMGVKIDSKGNGSRLTIYIDYEYPDKYTWLGKLFGKIYAKWCVRQMIKAASEV